MHCTVDTQQVLFPFYKYLGPPNLFSKYFSCHQAGIAAISSISPPRALIIPHLQLPTRARYLTADGRQLWTAHWGNRGLVLPRTFWKADRLRLFTIQTDQLEKLRRGGKLKCLEGRQRQAMGDEPFLACLAGMWRHRACMLLSPGQRQLQQNGPMESEHRESLLNHFPNGKEFCFLCLLGNQANWSLENKCWCQGLREIQGSLLRGI